MIIGQCAIRASSRVCMPKLIGHTWDVMVSRRSTQFYPGRYDRPNQHNREKRPKCLYVNVGIPEAHNVRTRNHKASGIYLPSRSGHRWDRFLNVVRTYAERYKPPAILKAFLLRLPSLNQRISSRDENSRRITLASFSRWPPDSLNPPQSAAASIFPKTLKTLVGKKPS